MMIGFMKNMARLWICFSLGGRLGLLRIVQTTITTYVDLDLDNLNSMSTVAERCWVGCVQCRIDPSGAHANRIHEEQCEVWPLCLSGEKA